MAAIACFSADQSAASRSRTPRPSRVRSMSPRDSRFAAGARPPAYPRCRFIDNEAEASGDDGDAEDDEGGEGEEGLARFIVPDHDSDSEHEVEAVAATDDEDETERLVDEGDEDEQEAVRSSLPCTPVRAHGASRRRESRTEVVSSARRSSQPRGVGGGDQPPADAAAQSAVADDEQETGSSPWPPCRLPPRLRESPTTVARRPIDFGITCTPMAHKVTEAKPNPVEPSDAQRLAASYTVMRKAARLCRSMQRRGVLIEAAGGMERGDVNGHPHAQIAGRAMSARTVPHWLEFMRAVFRVCCTEEHEIIRYYLSVVLRKKQTQEYAIGYCMKQFDRDWQQNRATDEGYFRIGALENEARVTECWDTYMAWAGDMMNEVAYGKVGGGRGGGTGGYNARRGGSKALDLNKSNFFSVAHDMMKACKMSDAICRTSTAKQVALVLEGGKHQLTPSWALSRSAAAQVSEAQIATVDFVNMNPYLAADVSLVRQAMYGYWERPHELKNDPVFWKPSVLPPIDVIESLSRAEAIIYSASLELPVHARLRASFPYVEGSGVLGYAVVIDLMYSFRGSSSERVASAIAQRGYSLTPNIFNDLGEGGLDCTGKYACAHVAMCGHDFGSLPLDHIGRYLCYAVRSSEYDLWVERTISGSASSSDVAAILDAFGVPSALFHGVMSADSLLASFDEICRSRPHDGFVHAVIIADEEQLADTSPRFARMRPEGQRSSDDADDMDEHVDPALVDAPLQPGSLVDIDVLDSLMRDDEATSTTGCSVGGDDVPLPEQLPRGGDADGIARSHHYMVCWRCGADPVQGDIHRYNPLDASLFGAPVGVEGEVISWRPGHGRPIPLGHDGVELPRRTPSRPAYMHSPRSRVYSQQRHRVSPNRSRMRPPSVYQQQMPSDAEYDELDK